jgi:hypothetical protein
MRHRIEWPVVFAALAAMHWGVLMIWPRVGEKVVECAFGGFMAPFGGVVVYWFFTLGRDTAEAFPLANLLRWSDSIRRLL